MLRFSSCRVNTALSIRRFNRSNLITLNATKSDGVALLSLFDPYSQNCEKSFNYFEFWKNRNLVSFVYFELSVNKLAKLFACNGWQVVARKSKWFYLFKQLVNLYSSYF